LWRRATKIVDVEVAVLKAYVLLETQAGKRRNIVEALRRLEGMEYD